MKRKKSITLLVVMSILLISIQACSTQSMAAVSSVNSPINPWDYQKQLGKGLDVDWSKTKDGMEHSDLRTVNNQIISKIYFKKKIDLKIMKNHQF